MNRTPIATKVVILFVLLISLGACARPSQPLTSPSGQCIGETRPDSACNVIQGVSSNSALPNVTGATISGGGAFDVANHVDADFGAVGGGISNRAGEQGTVAGGAYNAANAYRAAVGGGSSNEASSAYATVAGGNNNSASYIGASIGGGADNNSSGRYTTVAGGSGNVASFTLATVGGGGYDIATSIGATVAGGSYNTASGPYGTVAGGSGNKASGFNTTVGGGSGNFASGDNSTVAGGLANRVTGKYGTVAGGYENRAGTASIDQVGYGTVGGGATNVASGFYSTVPGGSMNTAAGAYSFAAGRHANVRAGDDGVFLFADSSNADFSSIAANEFAVRATGGVRLITSIDPSGNPLGGVRLAPGSGSWETQSDRNAKANIVPIDGRQVLAQLMTVPVSTWSYKAENPSTRHIGPMAQDFAAFGVGSGDGYISTVDENGVALAAIQGLDQTMQDELKSRDAEIASLKAENAAQRSQLSDLESRLAALENKANGTGTPASSNLPFGNLTFAGVFLLGLLVMIPVSRH